MFFPYIEKFLAFMTAVVIFFSGGIAEVPQNVTQDSYEGLKDVYADYFDIGTCVGSVYLNGGELTDFILKNFSSVTPEWELKQVTLNPAENEWHYEGMDKIADFCRDNGLKLRGHCLVWAQQDSWMLYDKNGDFVDKEVYYERLYSYMETVMNRYGDVIKVWDVVNEPFGYDLVDGEFKNYDVYKLCGEEYIEKAFTFARQIQPDATLVLNECGLAKNITKQAFVLKWLKKWQKMGIPIDAIGIQGHSNTVSENETPERLEAFICALEGIGVNNIQLTEIDMSIYYDKGDRTVEIQDWQRNYQTLKYKHLFNVIRRHKDTITSVSFWGPADSYSNLNVNGGNDEPLIFDKNLLPKASYYAITDF